MSDDTLANALSTIKNHGEIRKSEIEISPASNLIESVLEVMEEEEYLDSFEYIDDGKGGRFDIKMAGNINDCGVIKPRFSVKHGDFEKWEKRYLPAEEFGVLAVSTPDGVISHKEAKEEGKGGRLLAFFY